jgi:hypothetical protein
MPVIELTDFSGGVNSRISPIWQPSTNPALPFADADNFELSENGIIKYPGFSAVLSSAISGTPTVTGIFTYKSGLTLTKVVCCGTKIYTVSGATATEIKASQTADALYQSKMWNDGTNDILLLMNGVDKVVVYDGTTASAFAETDPSGIWDDARPQGAEIFNNRLVFWGDPTHPHRLYFPRPLSPTDGEAGYDNFDDAEETAGAIDVAPGYGGKLTGVKTLTDDLCILYKEEAILRMTGYSLFIDSADPITIKGLSAEVGCIAPLSIIQVGNDHYFMAKNGVRQLRPVEAYGSAEHLQPFYNIPDEVDAINWDSASAYSKIVAAYDQAKNQIYFAVPTGSSTTNDKVYVLDTVTRSIDPRSGFSPSVLAVHDRALYHGDYDGQLFLHEGTNNYDGEAVEAYAQTKWICPQGIGFYYRFKKLMMFIEGEGETNLVIQWEILKRGQRVTESDTEEVVGGGDVFDTALFDTATFSSGLQNVFIKKMLGRGHGIRFKFINNEESQRPKIRRIFLEYDVFSTKKG